MLVLNLSFTCRHARSLSIYREGLEAFHKAYPFLVRIRCRAAPCRGMPRAGLHRVEGGAGGLAASQMAAPLAALGKGLPII